MGKSNLLIGILMLFLLVESVSAYIDPGTGSVVIGSLWPLILAFFSCVAGFLIKYFWNPIKNIFKKKK